jgi:hypothetical protein
VDGVFVGFNDRDTWIQQSVFPMVEAFGLEIEDWMEAEGEVISVVVRRRIQTAGALLGFTTRRAKIDGDRWSTHRWVTDEI